MKQLQNNFIAKLTADNIQNTVLTMWSMITIMVALTAPSDLLAYAMDDIQLIMVNSSTLATLPTLPNLLPTLATLAKPKPKYDRSLAANVTRLLTTLLDNYDRNIRPGKGFGKFYHV